MTLRTGLLALAAAAFMLAGSGCANNKLAAERDSLAAQNKDLAAQLQAEREARQAAESRAVASNGLATAVPSEPMTPDMTGPLDLTHPVRGAGAAHGGNGAHATTPVVSHATAKVTLPGHILFGSGKVTLDAAATKTLDSIAATIKSKYSGQKLVIEGYTDSTPPSKSSVWTSNEDLAKARATAVRKYLVKKGIPDADMSVKAMGPTAKAANAAQDRRVEVAVLTSK